MGEVISIAKWNAEHASAPEPTPIVALPEIEAERLYLRTQLRHCLLRLWTIQDRDENWTPKKKRAQHVKWFQKVVLWVYTKEEEPHGREDIL